MLAMARDSSVQAHNLISLSHLTPHTITHAQFFHSKTEMMLFNGLEINKQLELYWMWEGSPYYVMQ